MTTTNQVAHLTWDEVDGRLSKGAAAILPIGSACKEHGLHLPMNTDQIQAEHYAACLAGEIDALIWPTLTYGYYPAFRDYPGSIDLDRPAFEAALTDLARHLFEHCPGLIFILNTGISTLPPVEAVTNRLNAATSSHRLIHLRAYAGPNFAKAAEQAFGHTRHTHADEFETSLMLAIAPDSVKMERAKPGLTNLHKIRPGPLSRSKPTAPNHTPTGSLGDPTKASANIGENLLAALIEDLRQEAQKALK